MFLSNLKKKFIDDERGRVILGRLLVVALILVTIGIGFGLSAERPKTVSPKALRVRGDVSIMAPGSAAWRQVNEREKVAPGTKIRTGKNSFIVLEIAERNFVRVGESAEFSLDAASMRREVNSSKTILFFSAREDVFDVKMNQDKGRVSGVLNGLHGKSSVELKTPLAVAAVRGTTMSSDVSWSSSNPGVANVSMFCGKGLVSVTPNTGNPSSLGPGDGIGFSGSTVGGAVLALIQLSPDQVSDFSNDIQQTANADVDQQTSNDEEEVTLQNDIGDNKIQSQFQGYGN